MKDQKHLAISSVPVQDWGHLYEQKEAFTKGTIFSDLDKPFYVTVEADQKPSGSDYEPDSWQGMLLQIQEISFVLDDVRLYLDMHPEEEEGIKVLKDYTLKRKNLLKKFADRFYPLTSDCMSEIFDKDPDTNSYCWQSGPAPWEGGYGHEDVC